ncbi:MAG: hypothetical protein IIW34_01650 [Clostridia bacterium]|nr:hypothetical protein [Clostridia bacterium]
MSFKHITYTEPDFNSDILAAAPDAKLAAVVKDGVAPENYHATGIYPEYFKIGGKWMLAEESRMDCLAVYEDGRIKIIEFRRLKKGQQVVLGRTEDGSEGIYVHMHGFSKPGESSGAFAFRQGRSRETAYTRDYVELYELLRSEKENGGNILWVMGPACAFDSDSREAMAAVIRAGYADGIMAGNALATHDLEAGLMKTALGQDIYTQEIMHNGHYNHIDTINKVRECGSIPEFIRKYDIKDGIIHACVESGTPFVLAGSIRDDGPLPEVIPDVYEAQNNMRALVSRATTIICMASVLHTVATGNMTPSYRVVDGKVRPLYFYSVDISEFAVNKLLDRGSLAVKTLVTNAQDFIVNVKKGLGL